MSAKNETLGVYVIIVQSIVGLLTNVLIRHANNMPHPDDIPGDESSILLAKEAKRLERVALQLRLLANPKDEDANLRLLELRAKLPDAVYPA